MDDDSSHTEQEPEPAVLAGRTVSHFRILTQIGRGGMGEVYEAEDMRLRRRVALKVLSSRWAGSASRRRKLILEARAAAAVSHPNIAVVHEVDEVDGVAFIAMERLAGSNLKSLLASGPLAVDEAVRIAAEIARGMAHAHRMQLVHRDLKPENVIVEPDGRVKILDFGLAKVTPGLLAELASADVTKEGGFVGTIAYASPEQVRGQAVEAPSDVFSLGVVLLELLTGTNPFRRATPAESLSAILNDTPAPPSAAGVASPQALDRLVARCLAKDPTERFQTAEGVLRALEELQRGGGAISARIQRRRTGWALASSATAALIVLGWLAVRGFEDRSHEPNQGESPAIGARAPRRGVAVLGFQNLSGRVDAAWLSTGLSEMLTTELMAGGGLRMVPGENVARMKIDLGISELGSLGSETLARVHDQLRADFVVLGSYVDLGDRAGGKIRLDLRLQDARDGEIVASIAETGTPDDLFDLVALAGTKLRAALGVTPDALTDNAAARGWLPSGAEATRLYAEGLDALRRFDALEARELLERSVSLEPGRAALHAALAAAWQQLGYESRAQEAAKRAYELSEGLPQEARLSIEAAYFAANREWDRALETYGKLCDLYPDNVEYVLRLTRVQTRAGQAAAALATLARFREREASEDPRIDLEEAWAASALSEMKRAVEAAARAVARSNDAGSRLLAADAMATQGWALSRLGKIDEAKGLLEDARDTFAAAGDRAGVARAMGNLAVTLREQGDHEAALKTFERVVEIASDIGFQGQLSTALNNMANVYYLRGDLDRAQSLYEQALDVDREAGNLALIPHRLGNLANVHSDRGDLERSRALHEQALAGFEAIGEQAPAARTLSNLGNLDLTEGKLASARERLEDCVARQRRLGMKRDITNALENLGLTLLAQDDLVGARRNIEESLRIRNELEEKRPAVKARVRLGSVGLEQGDVAEAERVAREAADFASNEHDDALRCMALRLLADTLLRQGKLPDARRAIDESISLTTSPPERIEAEILRARIQAASGAVAEARQSLSTELAEARRQKLLMLEFECRLAEGELELKAGSAAEARVQLAQLEREARSAGLLLIARRCRELAG